MAATSPSAKLTPWQRVFNKFGVNASALALAMGRHRSKLSRELNSPTGLISGKDQQLLMKAAAEMGVDLAPSDLTPEA